METQPQLVPWKNCVALRAGLAAGTSRKGKSRGKVKSKSKTSKSKTIKKNKDINSGDKDLEEHDDVLNDYAKSCEDVVGEDEDCDKKILTTE